MEEEKVIETLGELLEVLQQYPADSVVRGWIPGGGGWRPIEDVRFIPTEAIFDREVDPRPRLFIKINIDSKIRW